MPFDLDELFILEAERELGTKLPASYRSAMAQLNGGEVEVADDVWQLHPIADTSERKRLARTANHILRETAVMQCWPRFPAAALAIAANGSGDRLVFIRGSAAFEPAVHLWAHETGELERIAEDFSELQSV
jgi:hypothetical protein